VVALLGNEVWWAWTRRVERSGGRGGRAAGGAWEDLNVDSKSRFGRKSADFSNGGKFPRMPREYWDEPGTDHHVGLVMARQMFTSEVDPFAYRAAIMLTDGAPNGLGNSTVRAGIPFQETRWDEYVGPTPQSRSDIIADTVSEALYNYDEHNVHLWTVSFRVDNAFLDDATQGDGQYFHTTNAADLTPIFSSIANSLPLLIVQ